MEGESKKFNLCGQKQSGNIFVMLDLHGLTLSHFV